MDKASWGRLDGVHPDLYAVIKLADRYEKPFSFIVTEGVRTLARQSALVAAGKSQTMESRHLTGHAVDLAVVVSGKVEWALQLYVDLAGYVKQAAQELNIPIVWGGCWVKLNDSGDLDEALAKYIQQRKALGRRPFIDGPHFELDRVTYP